ncbi:MAG: PAS domain-containing sensor histidine kinase [Micavibrio sp.]|nr:PAS domain-containing sensor histidine kinase [Micavibrio sp.]
MNTTTPSVSQGSTLIKLFNIARSRLGTFYLTIAAGISCVATYMALTRSGANTDTAFWLLNLDLVLLLVLGTIIGREVTRIWLERKRGIAGAKLHTRLVLRFSLLASVPAIMMAIFSSVFLYFGVHAWFNDRVSTAVNESLEVAQAYLKEHQQVMRADVLAMANDLNRASLELMANPIAFNQMMQTQSNLRNLSEVMVFKSNGTVLAKSRLSFSLEMDTVPQQVLDQANNGDVVLMTGDTSDRIRALVKLDGFIDTYLYAGRLVDPDVLKHMQTVQAAVKEYTTLEGRKSQMQIVTTSMFVAVALLLLLAAIWYGLAFSETLVEPISALIIAAEKVRSGDLSSRVADGTSDDEIGMLGRTFNRMTSQLEGQQQELLLANRMMDERRRFTEAVLSGASSGVIGLDGDGMISLANDVAEELLQGVSDVPLTGRLIVDFIPEVGDLLQKALLHTDRAWALQTEYAVGNGPRKTVLVRITAEQGGRGAVATIDDISNLVSAQRKAAWADVARRIAHEIKNPLTPIQLSAERLKRKYLPQIADDPDTFDKCIETIIRQVNEIGHMVNEFSAYARMPVPNKRSENVVEVCKDALILQRQAHADIGFNFVADDPFITANCDRSQLTQVLTNLLQNAIDSIHERQLTREGTGVITFTLANSGPNVLISIEDNGLGLPAKDKDQLLEPYVTTKKKGSGLGLAIVKKIMEDHEGSVTLEDNLVQDVKSGAKAVIVFPKEV